MVTKKRLFFLTLCLTISNMYGSSLPLATPQQQSLIDLLALTIAAGSVLGGGQKTNDECRYQALATLEILNRRFNIEADGQAVMDALPQLEVIFSQSEANSLTQLMQQTQLTLAHEHATLGIHNHYPIPPNNQLKIDSSFNNASSSR